MDNTPRSTMNSREILATIQQEKARLTLEEQRILQAVRQRVLRYGAGFEPISDSRYTVLSEEERRANDSANRIDYILSKEIEYLLLNRRLSERLLDWLQDNKAWLLASQAFGAVGSALTYYWEHKQEIDRLVNQMLKAVLRRAPSDAPNLPVVALDRISPAELFAHQDEYSSTLKYLVDVSRYGVEIAAGDELAAWLDQQEAQSA
jgi:hypothetical protein